MNADSLGRPNFEKLKLSHAHGSAGFFFAGVGKLWVWGRTPPAASRDTVPVRVWEQSPQKLTTCFDNDT